MFRWGALTTLVVAGVWAAPARADETIRAQPFNQYSNPTVTIDQGEKLTFVNGDVATHDVTARQLGPDNRPLFASALAGQNESAEVVGAQFLTTGAYAFYCSVHPNMTGTLNVSTAGTPLPRPGGGSPADTTAPSARVRLLAGRLGRALRVSVSSNEAARVTLRATARVRGRTTTLATGRVVFPAGGTKRASLRFTAAGRRAVRSARRLRITVRARAVDSADNAATATGARTLRR